MGYRSIVLPDAEADLDRLSPPVRKTIHKKMMWLSDNADQVVHHLLTGMPEDLTGLCKLRVGDYRVLYWKKDEKKEIWIFRIGHRSEVYRKLS